MHHLCWYIMQKKQIKYTDVKKKKKKVKRYKIHLKGAVRSPHVLNNLNRTSEVLIQRRGVCSLYSLLVLL